MRPATNLRQAKHAGSWYIRDPHKLSQQLDQFLQEAKVEAPTHPIRAIIGPHAGFSYSAKTAAYAYKVLDPSSYDKIIVMGPSHRKYIRGVALCASSEIETPLGNLRVARDDVEELQRRADTTFEYVDLSEEEEEHSLEMHFPWIAKVFEKRLDEISVLPLIVGDLSSQAAEQYARILLKYLDDERILFVVSSDFCHWGTRFSYTYQEKRHGSIYESIQFLDHLGMEKIATLDPTQFRAYLRTYRNTICGRNPILLLMHMVALSASGGKHFKVDWLHYSQSSRVIDPDDSSVSYASGILVQE